MDGGQPAGGSIQLAQLIDSYGEILLPELRHYFGIDLRDLFSEVSPVTPRYVLVHIRYLPLESAFVAEQRGGQQFRGWNEARYMTAALLNAVRILQYAFVLAHSDPKKKSPDAPDPYPIPDGTKKAKRDKPGSFAFIAKSGLAKLRKKRKE